MKKAIVTAAITGGIHTPSMSPYLPITPKQIADEAVRAYEAGAAAVHIHARNPKTGQATSDLEIYGEILSSIKSRCNIVVGITTGGGLGMSVADRLKPVVAFKPEMASFNAGSSNFCLMPFLDAMKKRGKKFEQPWEEEYIKMTEDFIFPNTFKTMKEVCRIFAENNTKPELEVYDNGFIYNVAYLISQGVAFEKPFFFQFVQGLLGGLQPSVSNLLFSVNTAREVLGNDVQWSVCVAGRAEFPMCAAALAMGGNPRVGMEDNLWLGKGVMAKSNGELVERMVSIAQLVGVETATPDEARQMLGLKGIDKVNY